jgi:hypothetical protein
MPGRRRMASALRRLVACSSVLGYDLNRLEFWPNECLQSKDGELRRKLKATAIPNPASVA